MDYSQAAVKLFCSHLKHAVESPLDNAMNLHGILFQRAWLQGILVFSTSPDGFILDDGTGLIHLSLSPNFLRRNWSVGMYVLALGRYILSDDDNVPPMIQIHKLVDLSASPLF